MSIFLLVLKIIGIILLILIGLIILLTLAALIVPLRYKVEGEIEEHIKGTAVISFLLHLIHVRCEYYNEDFRVIVRILGIPKKLKINADADADDIEVNSQKSEKTKKRKWFKKRKKKEASETTEVKVDTTSSAQSAKERLSEVTKQDQKEILEVKSEEKDTKKCEGSLENQTEATKHSGKKRGKSKRVHRSKKKKSLIQRIKEGFKNGIERLNNIKSIIKEENNKYAVSFIYKEILYVLKHYGPRKLKTQIKFGTNDPAFTGFILGGISVFPYIYRHHVNVLPDFESDHFYFKGTFFMRGRIRIIHLLRSGIRILRDKKIRFIIKKYRK